MESIVCREGMAVAYSFRLACDCLNVVKSIQIEIYGQVILEIIVRKADFRSVEFVQVIRNPADGVVFVIYTNPPGCIKRVLLLKKT
jgi:hypothetical protein